MAQAHTPLLTCSEESQKRKGKERKSSSSSSSDGGVRGDELSVPNFHLVGDGLVCGALDDLPDHHSGQSQGEKPALPLLRVYALSQVPDHAPQKGQSYSAFNSLTSSPKAETLNSILQLTGFHPPGGPASC